MPASHLLDTNILSHLIKNPRGMATARLAALAADAVCTSIIVACELRYGAAKRASPALTQRVEALLERLPILPFDSEADRHYGEIRATLEREGQIIGGNDLLIAAHCRTLDLTLVSGNMREFLRVPGLRVENWLAD